jgi:ABC-type Na+ efflux pump permease subunit
VAAVLLILITHVTNVKLVKQLSDIVGSLPTQLRTRVKGASGAAQASYALAVYLFAPLTIIVPLTVSSAVEANTVIGERERRSGEFLAHSPASERQIYLGKLIASLVPGYLAAATGFGCYSLGVNLTVGPKVGGWFFPTRNWWILVVWVLPPFIALALAVILSTSAKVSSTAAAQQVLALVTLPRVLLAYAVASDTLFRAEVVAFRGRRPGLRRRPPHPVARLAGGPARAAARDGRLGPGRTGPSRLPRRGGRPRRPAPAGLGMRAPA